eukprot:998324-Alexandrium_andersonii.AAC.1
MPAPRPKLPEATVVDEATGREQWRFRGPARQWGGVEAAKCTEAGLRAVPGEARSERAEGAGL